MNELTTHFSLESWIYQSLKIEKWHGNLKESGEVIADGRWQNITIIIINVLGAGNKPHAEALPLAPAPVIISSQSHTGQLTPPGDSLRPSSWVGSGHQGPYRQSPKASKPHYYHYPFCSHFHILRHCSLPRGSDRAGEGRGHAHTFSEWTKNTYGGEKKKAQI